MSGRFEELDGMERDTLHVVAAHDPVAAVDVGQILEARRGGLPEGEGAGFRDALATLEAEGLIRVVDDDDGVELVYAATPDGIAAVEARLQWLLDMY